MEFLTVKETAKLLRLSPISIRRYIASGQLSAERVGRGIRVRREAIEKFIAPVLPVATNHDSFCWPHKPANHADADLVEIRSRSSPTGVMWVLIERLDDYLDEHVPMESDPFARGDDVEGEAQLPSVLDALGISVGAFRTGQSTNIAEHKDEYLADAFELKG
jgi:excisionase family DNA binding protein